MKRQYEFFSYKDIKNVLYMRCSVSAQYVKSHSPFLDADIKKIPAVYQSREKFPGIAVTPVHMLEDFVCPFLRPWALATVNNGSKESIPSSTGSHNILITSRSRM